jgi:ribonuclease H2 subunit A
MTTVRRQREEATTTSAHVVAQPKFDAQVFLQEISTGNSTLINNHNAENNNNNAVNYNEDSIILGIDEAGRGPAIGDMVYAAAMISIRQHKKLIECGVADSKQLDEKARNASREKMEKLSKTDDGNTFKALVLPVTSETISESMFGRTGRTLNTLSHQAAVALIRQATLLCKGKLAAVFVDTVGPPATYERFLKGRFPHLIIRVSKKADSLFPVVSAASIFAKTVRDETIATNYPNGECGSGYPSDERTVTFLNRGGVLNQFFAFTSKDIRQSWAPVVKIVKAKCIECTFEVDEERENGNNSTGSSGSNGVSLRQPTFTFAKQPPKRDAVFGSLLGFQSALAI